MESGNIKEEGRRWAVAYEFSNQLGEKKSEPIDGSDEAGVLLKEGRDDIESYMSTIRGGKKVRKGITDYAVYSELSDLIQKYKASRLTKLGFTESEIEGLIALRIDRKQEDKSNKKKSF